MPGQLFSRESTYTAVESHQSRSPNLRLEPALVWIPQRFSLRTLLIAMTLIAAVLGLIVALSR